MSSDVDLAPAKLVEYYKLRFQIEFLIRDAKGQAGLEACQARDQAKLDFYFNLALTTVSWVKAAYWLPLPHPSGGSRGAFSLRHIKLLFTGHLWTQRVFQSLDLDLSLPKYQTAYERCLNMEQLAA